MTPQNENPGAASTGVSTGRSFIQPNPSRIARPKPVLKVQRVSDHAIITLCGREAQTLFALLKAGEAGLTSGEFSSFGWGRRTSAYVHKLRVAGFDISTTRELVLPDAAVGRYHLLSPVVVIASFGLS
jgi:hypothetical protein